MPRVDERLATAAIVVVIAITLFTSELLAQSNSSSSREPNMAEGTEDGTEDGTEQLPDEQVWFLEADLESPKNLVTAQTVNKVRDRLSTGKVTIRIESTKNEGQLDIVGVDSNFFGPHRSLDWEIDGKSEPMEASDALRLIRELQAAPVELRHLPAKVRISVLQGNAQIAFVYVVINAFTLPEITRNITLWTIGDRMVIGPWLPRTVKRLIESGAHQKEDLLRVYAILNSRSDEKYRFKEAMDAIHTLAFNDVQPISFNGARPPSDDTKWKMLPSALRLHENTPAGVYTCGYQKDLKVGLLTVRVSRRFVAFSETKADADSATSKGQEGSPEEHTVYGKDFKSYFSSEPPQLPQDFARGLDRSSQAKQPAQHGKYPTIISAYLDHARSQLSVNYVYFGGDLTDGASNMYTNMRRFMSANYGMSIVQYISMISVDNIELPRGGLESSSGTALTEVAVQGTTGSLTFPAGKGTNHDSQFRALPFDTVFVEWAKWDLQEWRGLLVEIAGDRYVIVASTENTLKVDRAIPLFAMGAAAPRELDFQVIPPSYVNLAVSSRLGNDAKAKVAKALLPSTYNMDSAAAKPMIKMVFGYKKPAMPEHIEQGVRHAYSSKFEVSTGTPKAPEGYALTARPLDYSVTPSIRNSIQEEEVGVTGLYLEGSLDVPLLELDPGVYFSTRIERFIAFYELTDGKAEAYLETDLDLSFSFDHSPFANFNVVDLKFGVSVFARTGENIDRVFGDIDERAQLNMKVTFQGSRSFLDAWFFGDESGDDERGLLEGYQRITVFVATDFSNSHAWHAHLELATVVFRGKLPARASDLAKLAGVTEKLSNRPARLILDFQLVFFSDKTIKTGKLNIAYWYTAGLTLKLPSNGDEPQVDLFIRWTRTDQEGAPTFIGPAAEFQFGVSSSFG